MGAPGTAKGLMASLQLVRRQKRKESRQLTGDVSSAHSFQNFVCSLDRDYRYKSVATHIPHDTMLAMILYTGRKFLLHWEWN